MARQEHVLTVFVASPADVEAERGRLEEVIRELNVTWSRELGVRLDLVRWETHAYPGIGTDAQDVINNQIPEDYDFFIGIMWCRYGSPTGRAGSGTVEEFERAKARHNSDTTSLQLMMYFKDEPVPPSHMDPAQLVQINEFRQSLGEEGSLYWKFTDIDQFEKLVRLHLTRQVQSWKSLTRQSVTTETTPTPEDVPSTPAGEYDDDGILDLMEMFQDKFSELSETIHRIAMATEDVGTRMATRTNELNSIPKDARGRANPKDAKRVISRAASDLNQFTSRINAELPLYHEAMNTGMNAFIKAAEMSIDLKHEAADVQEGLNSILILRTSVETSKKSTAEFQESIASLPRMTTTLNRAKRGAVSSIDKLLSEFTDSENLLTEAEKVSRELLHEPDNP